GRLGVPSIMKHLLRNVIAAGLLAGLLTYTSSSAALASDHCDASSFTGDVCLCELAKLHPTQAAVGMVEIQIRAEKLSGQMRGRTEREFLTHLRNHDRIVPVIIGPTGALYITDHHH